MLAAGVLGFDPESVTQFFLNCLVVVGGFVVGFVLTALAAWAFDKWITHRTSPSALHKLVRYMGGLIVAILVAMYVFTNGRGSGGNGGGGDPAATSPGTGNAVSTSPTTATPPTRSTRPTQTSEPIRITILGATYREDGKYYLLDDEDKNQVSIEGVKQHIRKRKANAVTAQNVEIRLAPPKTTLNNPVVTMLQKWAESELRLGVLFPVDEP